MISLFLQKVVSKFQFPRDFVVETLSYLIKCSKYLINNREDTKSLTLKDVYYRVAYLKVRENPNRCSLCAWSYLPLNLSSKKSLKLLMVEIT